MYVDAITKYTDYKDYLLVAERVNGKRFIKEFPMIYEYYIPKDGGRYVGYDDVQLEKIECKTHKSFNSHKKQRKEEGTKTYEMYFNPINKVLYQHYQATDVPVLHKSYLDIEVDRAGFENMSVAELIDKANCPINAISIYNGWENKLYTLMLCPENLTYEEAELITNKFENCFLFKEETHLLQGIIAVLDEADVLSGWNSDGFDIPYIVRRVENLLGKESTIGLCGFPDEYPIDIAQRRKNRKSNKADTETDEEENENNIDEHEYQLPGKWLADYMVLYKKHTQSVKESYKLDSIAEEELGENKVEYEGSLEDLYRDDYEKFILYNRQDTMLVKKLDDKKNFIEIHNRQAHSIRCSLDATMGTVAWVDQAFINKAHDLNVKVPDRVEGKNKEFEGIIPPGAYVADPVKPFVEHVFSFDMNSLYPTTMRALNLSPETIIAQVKLTNTMPYLWNKIEEKGLWTKKAKKIPDWGKAWGGPDMWGTREYQEIMKQSDEVLTLHIEKENKDIQVTAKQIYDMVFAPHSNMSISGFGTIFRTDIDGLIPQIFAEWYSNRKKQKKKMEYYKTLLQGVTIDDDLIAKIKEKLNG